MLMYCWRYGAARVVGANFYLVGLITLIIPAVVATFAISYVVGERVGRRRAWRRSLSP